MPRRHLLLSYRHRWRSAVVIRRAGGGLSPAARAGRAVDADSVALVAKARDERGDQPLVAEEVVPLLEVEGCISTNLAHKQWGAVFPGTACVAALVDRFAQHCHVIDIDADSWRNREAADRAARKKPRA